MAGTRALFASIGASVVLVAAAALTLLAVSALFAFGGWGQFASPPAERSALVFSTATATASERDAGASRIVAPAPVRTASVERPSSSSGGPVAAASTRNTATTPGGGRGVIPPVDPLPPSPPLPKPPAPAPKPTIGDRVTKAGETLSGTVQSTGAALAEATEPLAAPVSAAVQQVLNLVAEAVRRTAAGLGGAVDSLLAPK